MVSGSYVKEWMAVQISRSPGGLVVSREGSVHRLVVVALVSCLARRELSTVECKLR